MSVRLKLLGVNLLPVISLIVTLYLAWMTARITNDGGHVTGRISDVETLPRSTRVTYSYRVNNQLLHAEDTIGPDMLLVINGNAEVWFSTSNPSISTLDVPRLRRRATVAGICFLFFLLMATLSTRSILSSAAKLRL